MKIVTAEQMREIEHHTAEMGLTSEVLMEKAGLAVAKEVEKWLGGAAGHSVLVLIGPGNNGGDGLVAARYLSDWGAEVHLYLCSPRADSDRNYQLAEEHGLSCILAAEDKGFTILENLLSSTETVLDALFGTGKTRPLEGIFKQTLESVERARGLHSPPTFIALDLPSGLNADTGAVDPACVAADVTITLAYPKLGLFIFPGAEKVGKIIVADIGIPAELGQDISTELITAEWARSVLPRRPLSANKGTFGKILVVAGSVNYIGAAYLACAAATRVGAGLVTLATARSIQPILAAKLTEVTYLPLPESEPGIIAAEASELILEHLANYDVLLLGCGLGQNPQVVEFVSSTLFSLGKNFTAPIVLDADALNLLAKEPRWWERLGKNIILTPHPGEMCRLTKLTLEQVQSDRLGVAARMAALWQKTVVLKGAHTVVAAPQGGLRISSVANPGLASAGTGDVLAGAIAGLLAQGLSVFDGAACGVYLHGEAAEMVKEKLGDAGLVASDLLPVLPLVIKKLKQKSKSGESVLP